MFAAAQPTDTADTGSPTHAPIPRAWAERGLVFPCVSDQLVGVLASPTTTPDRLGVVIVVGGPQYRAGSHRQFVLLARRLAADGHAVLRFDARGMGDSSGAPRSFTELDDDIAAAIDALRLACPEVQKIVLWGLCDGASAALQYWLHRQDDRVAALCLLNPWLRSEAGLAKTQVRHYYRDRLLQAAFWRKALSGGVGLRALSGFWRNLAMAVGNRPRPAVNDKRTLTADFRVTMAQAWQAFPGPILLLLSGKDYTAKEFLGGVAAEPAWRGALARRNVQRVDLPDADHTFSAAADGRACEQAVASWLHGLRLRSNPADGR
jgi:exosortase A-associated hydrolase 1